jgi:carbonic anhydrase
MRYKNFVIIAIFLLPSLCLAAQQKTPPENQSRTKLLLEKGITQGRQGEVYDIVHEPKADEGEALNQARAEWSYDDDYTGQEDWGNIKGYELCNDGAAQSPITISYTKTAPLPPLSAKYKTASGKIETTNKSFVINLKNAGKISFDGLSYSLQKIEFHSPSEHIIRDKFYPLEIHLFHKSDAGKTLIIAIFAEIGLENPAFLPVASQKIPQNFEINPSELLPKSLGYYSYTGSLPYPPCTEGVKWLVMKSPITISATQLATITRIVGRNSRLPQPVYLREILETM